MLHLQDGISVFFDLRILINSWKERAENNILISVLNSLWDLSVTVELLESFPFDLIPDIHMGWIINALWRFRSSYADGISVTMQMEIGERRICCSLQPMQVWITAPLFSFNREIQKREKKLKKKENIIYDYTYFVYYPFSSVFHSDRSK